MAARWIIPWCSTGARWETRILGDPDLVAGGTFPQQIANSLDHDLSLQWLS